MSKLSELSLGLLFGGGNEEREVSLKSAEGVGAAMSALGLKFQAFDVKDVETAVEKAKACDLVLSVIHGGFGEDGTLQLALDQAGIPYVGTGAKGSQACMDKGYVKTFWQRSGVPTGEFVVFKGEVPDFLSLRRLTFYMPYPLAVKPNRSGSSVGVEKVERLEDMEGAIARAMPYGGEVIVEPWFEGVEHTLSILCGQVLDPIRIAPSEAFYDFEAKYLSSQTRYEVAQFEPAHLAFLQKAAQESLSAFSLLDWARIDFMHDPNRGFCFLEVNTAPGMTPKSLLPKAALAAGISYESVIERVLSSAAGRANLLD